MAARRCIKIPTESGASDKLKRIYNRILRLTLKLPPDYAYRINTEAIICHRLAIINETENINEIENRICGGRMEMLVSQAKAEYELVQKVILSKPWEPLVEKPPPDQWKWPPVLE